jgi:hypothetical protein
VGKVPLSDEDVLNWGRGDRFRWSRTAKASYD